MLLVSIVIEKCKSSWLKPRWPYGFPLSITCHSDYYLTFFGPIAMVCILSRKIALWDTLQSLSSLKLCLFKVTVYWLRSKTINSSSICLQLKWNRKTEWKNNQPRQKNWIVRVALFRLVAIDNQGYGQITVHLF